ncbi:HAMP domain-containing sensor histidine kinase [Alkaliphilus sp. B6464]|uniref:HAMP domain-containing sensor histidine kinase n=1 Tax=Alkaliphilus sp. B6464 TaxID=2731219 RepID=UPI001BA6C8D5|nr:HAMP domain-containing sensor histidine kinase [Alkaliphilus sp. B6464]QUH21492.1 HAMP domain-containing histidine kinase [Alkaliphilus sp. B6464]
MVRNKELQSILIKVMIFQLLFGIIVAIVVNHYMGKINMSIVEQNQALIGSILNNGPQLEEEIIYYITKEISTDSIKLGEETLKKYGYTTKMDKSYNPILKNTGFSLQITVVIIISLFTLFLAVIINNEYNKIYRKVSKVSKAAEKVVEGDFNVYLKDEGEGEFSILNHQFNQMANRLKNSFEILKNEKIFLKNTISDISHQLKTPLSSLIMLNDLMLEDEDMEVTVRTTFLERSKVQLERMEWLIINLLKVARIEAGAIQFKREKVYLKDVLLLAMEALKSKFNIENISIEISKDLNGVFYGDKEWTVEALINILKNSIEHSDENQNIEVKIEETPLFSNITIKDYGKGIDKKDLPHIFKRFYRGDTGVKSDSIGIGLNLAKLIVELQEGSISVKSTEGKGTEFTLSFLKGVSNLTKK